MQVELNSVPGSFIKLWIEAKTTHITATFTQNGTDIPLVTDLTTWKNLNTPGYCWHDNNKNPGLSVRCVRD